MRGEIYDVIVDLRKDSPTLRRWCAVVVSSDNRRQIYIPAGCGHAFLCVKEADMLYIQSGCFDPPKEHDLNPFDKLLDIYWPELDDVPGYIMSQKDRNSPTLTGYDVNIASPIKRYLVIGASGQVGGALVEALGEKNVIGTFGKVPCEGMVKFNLEEAARDSQSAEELMDMCRPHYVFICAGRTWVDGCEAEGDVPYLVNGEGPRNVARAARRVGARTFYFSTDYVFEGAHEGHMYTESDETSPINTYGRSKLAGERAVLEEDPDSLVLRTTGVFGPEKQGKNFVYQLCASVSQGKDVMCPVDSFGSPTYNRDLAAMTIGLLEQNEAGIFHCVGPQNCSRYDFATIISRTWNLGAKFIKPTNLKTMFELTSARLGYAAVRGAHLALSNTKLTTRIPEKYHPRSIEDALLHWKANPTGAECNFN